MIVSYEGRTWCGAVADLRDRPVEGEAVVAAIRGEPSQCGVHCRPPGPLFERVGHVHPEMGLRVRTALAEAARTRGLTAPQDDRLARLRAEREAIDLDDDGPQRASAPTEDPEALRERVATLRGRVRALEAEGEDPEAARADLRAAAAKLSAAETTRIAAAESRRQSRAQRDRRDRRMRLDDRIANLERDARSALVDQVRERYERAVFALDPTADPFDAAPPVAALAVLRVGSIDAPVVLETDRFATPAAAAAWIEGPVIRVG